MKNRYVITSKNEIGVKFYFLLEYGVFHVKYGTEFTNKRKAKEMLRVAKRYASEQVIADNVKVEQIYFGGKRYECICN